MTYCSLVLSQSVGLWSHWSSQQRHANQLQHAAADGAGEGVSLQQVPDAGAARGDSSNTGTERDPGEDLVPEQTNEAEETRTGRSGHYCALLLIRDPQRVCQGPGGHGPLFSIHLPGSVAELRDVV